MSKNGNCPEFKPPEARDLDALIAAVRVLYHQAQIDNQTPCDIEQSVLGKTGYELVSEGRLESLIKEWQAKQTIDLTGHRDSLLLRAPSTKEAKIDKGLLIRMTLEGGTIDDFKIGIEFFSKSSKGQDWGVLAIHFDPPNPNEPWKFAHVQTAVRGAGFAGHVLDVMDLNGHGRLPRVPVPADSIVDLMRVAVLSIYGAGKRYVEVTRSMARPVVCQHLRGIAG